MVSRDWSLHSVRHPISLGWRSLITFDSHGIDSYWPFKRTFRTIVLSFLPSSFSDALASVLLETFYDAESRPHDVSPLSTVRTASETRQQLANALEHIGILLDFKTLINSSLDKEIEKRVLETCAGVRDIHCLPMLRAWFNEKVKGWMTDIFGKGANLTVPLSYWVRMKAPLFLPERPDAAYRKFEHHMLQVLCDLRQAAQPGSHGMNDAEHSQCRISELFDIIVDYEDKTHPLPVLQDLKVSHPSMIQACRLGIFYALRIAWQELAKGRSLSRVFANRTCPSVFFSQ